MDRYLIESPHDADGCRQLVMNVNALGYLNNCDWGCTGGVHKAWVIIQAENEKQALLVVPFPLRKNATAIKLVKFDPEMVKEWKV